METVIGCDEVTRICLEVSNHGEGDTGSLASVRQKCAISSRSLLLATFTEFPLTDLKIKNYTESR